MVDGDSFNVFTLGYGSLIPKGLAFIGEDYFPTGECCASILEGGNSN